MPFGTCRAAIDTEEWDISEGASSQPNEEVRSQDRSDSARDAQVLVEESLGGERVPPHPKSTSIATLFANLWVAVEALTAMLVEQGLRVGS